MKYKRKLSIIVASFFMYSLGSNLMLSIGRIAILLSAIIISSVVTAEEARESEVKKNANIEEVEVKGSSQAFDPTEMDATTRRLLKMPGTGGDPLAALQSLPGVSFSSDEDSAPAIRGSGPDDNTYLIDFMPARYLFHIFGNSILNENVVQRFDLYPAAYSSRFGNATGGVLDVTLREPKNQDLLTVIDYSFLQTGIFLESRVTENQAFYFSYRKSLLDVYYDEKGINDDIEEEGDVEDKGLSITKIPVSDDYQFKYLWNINPEHRLSFVVAGASDKVGVNLAADSSEAQIDPDAEGELGFDESFNSFGVIWDWQVANDGSALKTALNHSAEEVFFFYGNGQQFAFDVAHVELKTQYGTPLNANHWLTVGGRLASDKVNYLFDAKYTNCNELDPECSVTDAKRIRVEDTLNFNSYNIYVEDEWFVGQRTTITPGVHTTYDDYLEKAYIEPRLRSRYEYNASWAFTAATGLYHQFPDFGEVLPELGNPELIYPEAIHYELGFENKISAAWNWSTQIYFKDLDDWSLSLQEGRDADFEELYANDASGEAYGVEFLLNRNLTEKWYGWASLSYAKTKRQNDRTGETQNYAYDRPLSINVVANYQLTQRWNVGFKWRGSSGSLYTPIIGLEDSTVFPDVKIPVYGEINSERTPFYHRLDVRAEWEKRMSQQGRIAVFVDMINFLNRENIEGYSYNPNVNPAKHHPKGFAKNVPVVVETGMEFFPSIGLKITF